MTLTINETVNEKAAAYIKDAFGVEDLMIIRDFKTKKDAKEALNTIKNYVVDMLKDNCSQDVVYDYPKDRTDGRKYSKFAIQGITREIRGLLCEGITTDIDQVNSHPVILKYLCDYHNINCRELTSYVSNRESVLKEMMMEDNIDRFTAKTLILQMTNSSYPLPKKYKGAFITQYAAELKRIQKSMSEVRDYAYIKNFIKSEVNFLGVFMSHLLQINEDKILTSMYDFLIHKDYKVHSLMFDGLMVYGNHYNNTELIADLEKQIVEDTGIDMKLAYKYHDDTLCIPADYETEDSLYLKAKEAFELNNFKFIDKFVYINDDKDFFIKSVENFKTIHQELGTKFLQRWLEDPDKRSYRTMDQYPNVSACPPTAFNMWKPFSAEMADYSKSVNMEKCEAGLAFFLNHLKALVGGNQEHYEFALMWLAQMVQYPEHKSVEMVFIGGYGTGKGLFCEFLSTLLGAERVFQTANPQRDIYGTFNGSFVNAFLVIQNEANKSNTYGKNDMKKDLITENTISINIKNGACFTMKSFHRFLTFTNNDDPINLTRGDRRSVVFRDFEPPKGNDYYQEGFNYAEDLDVAKSIYQFLMKCETKPKINKSDFPANEYQDELVEMNKPIIEEWFIDYLVKTNIVEKIFISVADLWTCFKEYCRDANFQLSFYTKREFYKDLTFKLKLPKPVQKKYGGVNLNRVQIDFELNRKKFYKKEDEPEPEQEPKQEPEP
tara:strand:- start:1109 stop:3265 length:2157 start_codon:yes stop_codon:yes gene_type:complete